MKIIVTHISPDLDAATSSWLIHRYLPGWKSPQFLFVPAGTTLNNLPPDDNKDIIHVDTGYGKFDHHQTSEETCASLKVLNYLTSHSYIKSTELGALIRLVNVVNRYDHFKEVYLDDPNDDMHDFSLNYLLRCIRVKTQDDYEVMHLAETLLDSLLIQFKNKVNAERAILKGYEFTSYWGKTIAIESENDETLKVSFRHGYDMAIRKSKQFGQVRIKLHPKLKKSLKKLYKMILTADSNATWFYHQSGKMLLNGSSKSGESIPSKLSLQKVITLVKKIT